MQAPKPGWYNDPHDNNKKRWWDGANWTSHTQDIVSQPLGYTPRSQEGFNQNREDQYKNKKDSGSSKEDLPRSSENQQSSGERHFKIDKKGRDVKASSSKLTLQNVSLLVGFLALLGSAVFFAVNSKENINSAQKWQKNSNKWQQEAQSLKGQLLQSEADVKSLEKRQSKLANEKATAEDERNYLANISADLVEVGKGQELCVSDLSELVDAVADEDLFWVNGNIDRIASNCVKASSQFQRTLNRLGL